MPRLLGQPLRQVLFAVELLTGRRGGACAAPAAQGFSCAPAYRKTFACCRRSASARTVFGRCAAAERRASCVPARKRGNEVSSMFSWGVERLANLLAGPFRGPRQITFPRLAWPPQPPFLLALVLGPRVIAWLGRRFREAYQERLARSLPLAPGQTSYADHGRIVHRCRPGGRLLVFGRLASPHLQAALVVALGLAAVGAVDDLVKLRGTAKGLSAGPSWPDNSWSARRRPRCSTSITPRCPGGLLFPRPPAGTGVFARRVVHPLGRDGDWSPRRTR